MRLGILLIIIITLATSCSQTDCFDEVIKEKIEMSTVEDIDEIIENVKCFEGHGFESEDIKLFGSKTFLPIVMVQLTNEVEKPTYQDLYDKLSSIKSGPNYEKLKNDFFNGNKQYKTNSGNQSSNNIDALVENKGAINIEDLLIQSKNENKPIVLHFTGYSVVSGRKFESNVLSQVDSELLDQIIFVSYYVDDKELLDKAETIQINKKDKEVKTIGDHNLYYQMNEFQNSSQPYIVGLDESNGILSTSGYAGMITVQDFEKLLKEIITKYSN